MSRIAIVDHDEELGKLLTELFTLEGYESVTWSPADGTADGLCSVDADLILFDGWFAAAEKGWTLLRTLQRDRRTAGTPIVICSGDRKALEENAAWLQAEGILAISKPFNLEQLFDAIEGCLHDRRQSHALSGH